MSAHAFKVNLAIVDTDVYRIDEDVPIPPRPGGHRIYPWQSLKPGTSMFIKTNAKTGVICSAAKQWAKRRNIDAKYVSRRVTENGKRGVRVWRLS